MEKRLWNATQLLGTLFPPRMKPLASIQTSEKVWPEFVDSIAVTFQIVV